MAAASGGQIDMPLTVQSWLLGMVLMLIIGIVVGTLSSIFFASPILLWLGVSKKDLMPVTRDNPELARRP